MIYTSNLNAINALCIAGGGAGTHKSNLAGLNQLITQNGGNTTYRNELSALNGLLVLLGGSGGYKNNLSALNALAVLVGGTGGWHSNRMAWSEVATIGLSSGNHAPLISNQSFSIAENSANNTVVGTVVASDPDNDALTYSIVGGNDSDIFKINSTTGVLAINDNSNLDFEFWTNDGLTAFTEIVVRVSDGTLHTDATITINITNVGEIPEGARSRLDGYEAYSGGYRMIDVSGNGNHAPLVKSYCNKFTYVDNNNHDSAVVLTPSVSAINLSNSVVTSYKCKMRLDNLTRAKDASHPNLILYNGADTNSAKGFKLWHHYDGSKCVFVVQVSNGTRYQSKTFTTALDGNWHTYTFSWNPSTMVWSIDIDGTTESIAFTAPFTTDSGRDFAYTSGFTIGQNYGCGDFTMAKFSVYRDGVLVFLMPFQSKYAGVAYQKHFDVVSGSAFSAFNITTVESTNDIYPGNILWGCSHYKFNNSPYQDFYVPYVLSTKTGTITTSSSSANVTGSGTLFTTELSVGNELFDSNNVSLGRVLSITDNTHLVLRANAASTNSGIAFKNLIPATHRLTLGTSGNTWKLIAEHPASAGHNTCETLMQVNTGVEITGLQAKLAPFKRYIPGQVNNTSVNDILVYTSDLTEAQLSDGLMYMNYSRPKAWIFVGDSIISVGHGATNETYDSLITSLTGDLANSQPLAKIANYLTRTVDTLTPANSTQVHVEGYFSPRLSQALEYAQEVWLCGYSVSGSSLWLSWRPNDPGYTDYLDITKLTIDDLFLEMIKSMKYPVFEVYCSLGTNDASISGDAVTLFGEHFDELMADLRAYVYQSQMEWNILRPRKNSANKIIIATYFESLAQSDIATKLYDLEKYYTNSQMPDGIHFNYAGTVQCGIDLANKDCLSFQ